MIDHEVNDPFRNEYITYNSVHVFDTQNIHVLMSSSPATPAPVKRSVGDLRIWHPEVWHPEVVFYGVCTLLIAVSIFRYALAPVRKPHAN